MATSKSKDTGLAKPKRQYKSSGERRKEILEVASKLFLSKGFVATGVKDIVRAVGISYGNFYYHFPTKQDIMLAFVQAKAEWLDETIREWERDSTLTPTDQMSKIMDYIDSFRDFRMSVDFLQHGEVREDPELYDMFINVSLEKLTACFTRVIAQGHDSGEFSVEDPEATALLIVLISGELLHRVANAERIVDWKRQRRSHRIMIARTLGLADDAFQEQEAGSL